MTFVTNSPSEGALSSLAMDGGGVAFMQMQPASSLHLHNQQGSNDASTNACVPLNMSTYTAGEDAGRLAMLAKEFGLARIRSQKSQLRKHAFKPFLRNQSNDLNEDIPIKPEARDEKHITRADAIQSNKLPQSTNTDTDTTTIQQRHPPLRFVFSGYSLWLELEQQDIDDKGRGDLDRAMIDAADRFSLGGAIPSPHVTALYGICTIDNEEEMRRMFREDVKQILVNVAEKQRRNDDDDHSDVSKKQSKKDCDSVKLWPDLDAVGIIVGTEFDGVDGGTMDMAWAEVTLATSPEHEMIINALHELFYRRSTLTGEDTTTTSSSDNEEKKEEYLPRSTPWVPHLSICYDNPEGFGPNLTRLGIENFLRECPTLGSVLNGSDGDGEVKFTRAVSGISLWRTVGRMDEWACLERLEF